MAASCDLGGEGGGGGERVSVIIRVAADEKLRVRIIKTMGEWLVRIGCSSQTQTQSSQRGNHVLYCQWKAQQLRTAKT